MNPRIPTIGIYKHYKGNMYQILHVGVLEKTLEPVVIYRAVGSAEVFVRTVVEWNEILKVDGTWCKRFEFVGGPPK